MSLYSESSTTSEVKFEAEVDGYGDVIANTSAYSNGTKIVGINVSNETFIYYKPTGTRILLTLTPSTGKRTLTAKFSKLSSKMSIGDGFNTSEVEYMNDLFHNTDLIDMDLEYDLNTDKVEFRKSY